MMIMSSAIRSIENILIDGVLNPQGGNAVRNDNISILFLCGIFICLGLVFLIYGAYLYMLTLYSPQVTAVMTGILSIAIALVMLGFVYLVTKYRSLKAQKTRLKILEGIKSTLSSLDDEVGDPIRNHPKLSVTIAALSGFILENKLS
jgi:energy-converting hydrogenase Eha subunit E